MPYPWCRWLYRSFLSPADNMSAAMLTEPLVFSLADDLSATPLAATVVSFFRSLTTFRPCHLLNRPFLSLADSLPPYRELHRSFLTRSDDIRVAPIAVSLVSFSR
jgi:hypothetical protein